MFDLTKRPWRRRPRHGRPRQPRGGHHSLVALTAAGSADASPRGDTARRTRPSVQAVRDAALSATLDVDQGDVTSQHRHGTTAVGSYTSLGTFVQRHGSSLQRTRGDRHRPRPPVARTCTGSRRRTMFAASKASVSAGRAHVRSPPARPSARPRRSPLPRLAATILNLVLGPLDLNLLGLVVHLNKVVLDIIAPSGAGNLLGNLLCAVAGLLDGAAGRLLGQVTDLLNSDPGDPARPDRRWAEATHHDGCRTDRGPAPVVRSSPPPAVALGWPHDECAVHPGPAPPRRERVERQEPVHRLGRRRPHRARAAPRPRAAAS